MAYQSFCPFIRSPSAFPSLLRRYFSSAVYSNATTISSTTITNHTNSFSSQSSSSPSSPPPPPSRKYPDAARIGVVVTVLRRAKPSTPTNSPSHHTTSNSPSSSSSSSSPMNKSSSTPSHSSSPSSSRSHLVYSHGISAHVTAAPSPYGSPTASVNAQIPYYSPSPVTGGIGSEQIGGAGGGSVVVNTNIGGTHDSSLSMASNVEVLLVRRRHPPQEGWWGLPGGMLTLGESLAHAAAREVSEECGIKINVARPFYATDVIETDEEGEIQTGDDEKTIEQKDEDERLNHDRIKWHYALIHMLARPSINPKNPSCTSSNNPSSSVYSSPLDLLPYPPAGDDVYAGDDAANARWFNCAQIIHYNKCTTTGTGTSTVGYCSNQQFYLIPAVIDVVNAALRVLHLLPDSHQDKHDHKARKSMIGDAKYWLHEKK